MMTESPSDQEAGQMRTHWNDELRQCARMRIVTLDRVYRWTERNACVFPFLPACSGSDPIQFVTVFVAGNRFLWVFASLRGNN
jgi:hypothetical protein